MNTTPLTFTTLPPLEKKRAFWAAILGKITPEVEERLHETPRLTVDEILEYLDDNKIGWHTRKADSGVYHAVVNGYWVRANTPEDALAMALFKLKGIEAV